MFSKKNKNNNSKPSPTESYDFLDQLKDVSIHSSLSENKAYMDSLFTDCSDIVVRPFELEDGTHALVVMVDGLVNSELLERAMDDLMTLQRKEHGVSRLLETSLPVAQAKSVDNYYDFLLGVMSGDTGVIIGDASSAILLGIRAPESRSIEKAQNEAVIRGPREGFIENIRSNTALVRRKIKTPLLKMKSLTLGRRSNTSLVIAYIDGIVDPALVTEVEGRLNTINTDIVMETGFIEEFIQDSSFSPFPQMQYTERPDVVAGALSKGRVAIFVDGTPMVLLVPTVFLDLLHVAEDEYERALVGTLTRWLRYLFLFFSLLTPSLYIAILTFHQEMLPSSLLRNIAAARQAIPFPVVIEVLILEIIFEALREAGIRLPKDIGSAVGILGAIVIGQAAVEAGIVSAPVVIIVSLTGIASFTNPNFNGAIAVRLMRFPFIFISAFFGIYGIMLGIMFLIGHLADLRSFGVPYLSPAAPLSTKDLKNTIVRYPHWAMETRPSYLNVQDHTQLSKETSQNIGKQSGQPGTQIPHPAEEKETGSGGDFHDQ